MIAFLVAGLSIILFASDHSGWGAAFMVLFILLSAVAATRAARK